MPDAASFIVATAGHVDHGKSALVTALTGTDPDRLPEEKARGITIDLGFASLDVRTPSGDAVHLGIVDVPGHEDFVRNMAAGVGAADLALIVVAADDGWMPQTEEHLQVLTYFGVRRAVIVLTKADLTANLGRALEGVRQKLEGTDFATAPIVPTSIVGRQGIEELKDTLGRVLATTPPSRDIGRPRLPIDRVFTLPGIGTVVTGTLLGGVLRQGQRVVAQPSGKTTWIRRMHSHNRDEEVCGPGRRIALNLPDVGVGDMHRGDVVTVDPGRGPTSVIDVRLTVSHRTGRSLRNGTRAHVHYGSGHVGARVVLLDEKQIESGGSGLAQLRLDRRVFVCDGDRLTIRDWAEQATLAGGLVLDTDASPRAFHHPKRRQFLSRRADAPDDPVAWVESLIERDNVVSRLDLLAASAFSAIENENAIRRVVFSGRAVSAGPGICGADAWAALVRTAAEAIDAEHARHPDRRGMPLADLRARLGPGRFSLYAPAQAALGAGTFDALVAQLCQGGFARDGSIVRRATHRASLPSGLEAAGAVLRATLAARPLDPPSRKLLAPDAASARALRFLVESGEAVEVSAELVITSEQVQRAREVVVAVIAERGAATLGDFRVRLECTRRVLLPLLEYSIAPE